MTVVRVTAIDGYINQLNTDNSLTEYTVEAQCMDWEYQRIGPGTDTIVAADLATAIVELAREFVERHVRTFTDDELHSIVCDAVIEAQVAVMKDAKVWVKTSRERGV